MKILFKSPWNKVKGQTKILCSKLTHDELLRIEGEKDKQVRDEVKSWLRRINISSSIEK